MSLADRARPSSAVARTGTAEDGHGVAVWTRRGRTFAVLAATIGCTALMGDWQARNHERRRELLSLASRTDPLTGFPS